MEPLQRDSGRARRTSRSRTTAWGGRRRKVTDAVGTREFVYNSTLDLDQEKINEGTSGGLYSKTITRKYETAGPAKGRDTGFFFGTDEETSEYTVTYSYDDPGDDGVGRLLGITGPGLSAHGVTYSFLANSNRVASTLYKDAGDATAASVTRTYTGDASTPDHRDLLGSVENKAGSGLPTVSMYAYAYDEFGRRTSVVNTGSAFSQAALNNWAYNDRSELVSSYRHQGTDPNSPGTEVGTERRTYTYDPIGNRKTHTDGSPPATTTYKTTNALNQYEEIVFPSNPTEFLGCDADGNLLGTGFVASDFNHDGDVDYGDAMRFFECHNGPNHPPAQSGCETADADDDGDVDVQDFAAVQGCFNGPNTPPACANPLKPTRYVWDAENRLTAVEPIFAEPNDIKVEFAYDYMNRRVQKKVSHRDGTTWVLDEDWRFVYDQYNAVLVLNGNSSNATTKKYTWGLDLSGLNGNPSAAGVHGAGGIGGLLAVTETGGTHAGSYWFLYDANGNVGQLVKASDQTTAARYEYDPYGNTIVKAGDYADANPYRFSTKWFDAETNLYYNDNRYYIPRLGRWISRDPIGERGGVNLFAYVGGGPTNRSDAFGMWGRDMHYTATYDEARAVGYNDRCAGAIAAGNQGQDDFFQLLWDRHFQTDVLGFPDGGASQNQYLMNEAETMSHYLREGNCQRALEAFGRMIHTAVQDRTSHMEGTRVAAGNAEPDHQASTPIRHITGLNARDGSRPDRRNLFGADFAATVRDTNGALAAALPVLQACPCRCHQ